MGRATNCWVHTKDGDGSAPGSLPRCLVRKDSELLPGYRLRSSWDLAVESLLHKKLRLSVEAQGLFFQDSRTRKKTGSLCRLPASPVRKTEMRTTTGREGQPAKLVREKARAGEASPRARAREAPCTDP